MRSNQAFLSRLNLNFVSALLVIFLLSACGNTEDAQKLKDALALNKLNISALNVISPNTIIEFDATEQFRAEAIIGDGSGAPLDVSSRVQWSVSNNALATINASGLLAGKADGLITVMAQLADLTATKDLDLSSAELSAISIINNPSPVSVCKSGYRVSAQGSYNDATTRDISSLVSWSSNDSAILAIDQSGEFSALKDGTASITATRNAISGSDTVTINNDISSILISSPSTEVNIGSTLAFTATGTYNDASTANITNNVIWSSDDETRLVISNSENTRGIASGVTVGNANIEATCLASTPTTSNSAQITVSLAPVISDVVINDGNENLEFKIIDSPEQLSAKFQLSDNTLSTDVTDDDDTDWRVVSVTSGVGASVSNVKGSKGEISFSDVGITIVGVRYDNNDGLGPFEDEVEVEVIEN